MTESMTKAELVRLYNEQQELLDHYRAENERLRALAAHNATHDQVIGGRA